MQGEAYNLKSIKFYDSQQFEVKFLSKNKEPIRRQNRGILIESKRIAIECGIMIFVLVLLIRKKNLAGC